MYICLSKIGFILLQQITAMWKAQRQREHSSCPSMLIYWMQAARAAAITHTSKHTIPDKSTFPSMWTHRKPEAGRAAGQVISVISVTGLYTHEVYSGHWLSKPIRFGAQPSIPQILLNFSYMHFLQTIMRTLNIVLVKCNLCSGQKTAMNSSKYDVISLQALAKGFC